MRGLEAIWCNMYHEFAQLRTQLPSQCGRSTIAVNRQNQIRSAHPYVRNIPSAAGGTDSVHVPCRRESLCAALPGALRRGCAAVAVVAKSRSSLIDCVL